ncbi:MAG: transposase [Candidatus Magasanikbacteria bacterium]|nr:transposase [Candidatus Magasanikbacteria bacterium]
MKKIDFQNDNYYHVYNRGVDKRKVFLEKEDFVRFLVGMREFNSVEPVGSLYMLNNSRRKEKTLDVYSGRRPTSKTVKLVEFVAYCLNDNHYHFILKQVTDRGVSEFMKRVGGGYTKYFNDKYKRSGALFQGRFKSVELESSDKIIQLSAYVNGNSKIHSYSKADEYCWSSNQDYLLKRSGTICDKEIVMQHFSDIEEYRSLCDTIICETKEERVELANYLLEN